MPTLLPCILLFALAIPAAAQTPVPPPPPARHTVLFQVTQTTTPGTSVFLLGDLPELGSNQVPLALKLDPSAYPVWKLPVSLPAGTTYSFRFLTRADAPRQTSIATNGTFISPLTTASTPPIPNSPAPNPPAQAAPLSTADLPAKTFFLSTTLTAPVLFWRPAPTAANPNPPYAQTPLTLFAPPASPSPNRPGERLFFATVPVVSSAPGPNSPHAPLDFFFADSLGNNRSPASGTFSSSLPALFSQAGQLFSYFPAANPDAPRRDYNPASPPAIQSSNLAELRRYRVFLPRGYAQHPERRYPVLYFHDGQNVFESGPFGSWNAASTISSLQAAGLTREFIAVGVDNTANRLSDYLPPGDTLSQGPGRADRYARFLTAELIPLINANYRTLTGPDNTATLGSSMGGVVSLYLGWDFNTHFSRLGLLSGAWWTCPNFRARVTNQATFRPLRIYIDSGDSGTSNDDYWNTYNLRDSLASGSAARYPTAASLLHVVGFNDEHNEAAWSRRLPRALTFLFPAADETPDLATSLFNPLLDTNADGRYNLDDLHTLSTTPRDVNLDGAPSPADTQLLTGFLRRAEPANMRATQR